jgi:hypothetical protein
MIIISQNISDLSKFGQIYAFVDDCTSTFHSELKHFVKDVMTNLGFLCAIYQLIKCFNRELILYFERQLYV